MSTNATTINDGPDSTFYCTNEPAQHNGTLLGFWIYLMSDCFIFASLFVANAVLGSHYAMGPTGSQALDLVGLAWNTAFLLVSSVTFGFAMLQIERGNKRALMSWLVVAGILAAIFVGLEIHEFASMIAEGWGPDKSAFLSSFFALVGTHGLHVSFGILWLIVLLVQLSRFGLTPENLRRLRCLSMFWHFLDLIWVGVFSYVYLVGVLR